jgi:ABC-type sugar transport system substrate-binding protein
MEKQIGALSNLGLLSRFVGMVTDSRSFLSYSRHEYFRRLLCNILGNDVSRGLLPTSARCWRAWCRDVCFFNGARLPRAGARHAGQGRGADRRVRSAAVAGTRSVALLLDDPGNLYQQLLAREAQLAASAHKLTLQPPDWAKGSPWTQIESINAMLRKDARPDGVVIMLAGRLTRGPAERLVKAGLAVVFIQRIPEWVQELTATYKDTLVASVSPRQEKLGEIQARHAQRLVPHGGFALLVTGDLSTPAAAKRKQGFIDAADKRLQVQALDGRWSAAGTEQVIGEWLRIGAERERKIDLVVCANDAMAAAARRTLARHGVDVTAGAFHRLRRARAGGQGPARQGRAAGLRDGPRHDAEGARAALFLLGLGRPSRRAAAAGFDRASAARTLSRTPAIVIHCLTGICHWSYKSRNKILIRGQSAVGFGFGADLVRPQTVEEVS